MLIGTVLCEHRYILEGGVAQSGHPQTPENIDCPRQFRECPLSCHFRFHQIGWKASI